MASRIDRISHTVKKELSDIIQNKLKDPRIPEMVSIVSVEVTAICGSYVMSCVRHRGR